MCVPYSTILLIDGYGGLERNLTLDPRGELFFSIYLTKHLDMPGFISGFLSSGGKHIVVTFKRGQIQILRGAAPY